LSPPTTDIGFRFRICVSVHVFWSLCPFRDRTPRHRGRSSYIGPLTPPLFTESAIIWPPRLPGALFSLNAYYPRSSSLAPPRVNPPRESTLLLSLVRKYTQRPANSPPPNPTSDPPRFSNGFEPSVFPCTIVPRFSPSNLLPQRSAGAHNGFFLCRSAALYPSIGTSFMLLPVAIDLHLRMQLTNPPSHPFSPFASLYRNAGHSPFPRRVVMYNFQAYCSAAPFPRASSLREVPPNRETSLRYYDENCFFLRCS